MRPTFVFLHVGGNFSPARLLVQSLRSVMPASRIIQCTDEFTPGILGVDEVVRVQGDVQYIMTFRLKAFAEVGLNYPAMYLDTDMLVQMPIDPFDLLGGAEAAFCRREFYRDLAFNTSFAGLDLSEYRGMTLDQVYPYIACSSITPSCEYWSHSHEVLLALDRKYHMWYGDQEAICKINRIERVKYVDLPESDFGCLPEFCVQAEAATIVHFKGPSRKMKMSAWAMKLGLLI